MTENSKDRQYDASENELPEHEDPELSFIEHLVELRSRLLKSCSAVLVVLIVLLPFSRKLYSLLATPLTAVVVKSASLSALPFLMTQLTGTPFCNSR